MNPEKIARINELAKKSRSRGLNASEKLEQTTLRCEYIDAVKNNLKAQLDRIEFVDKPARP